MYRRKFRRLVSWVIIVQLSIGKFHRKVVTIVYQRM